MGTPLSEHFKNQTLLQDAAAPLPVQDVGALLTTEDIFTKDVRFKVVTQADVKDYSANTVTYNWLTAYFGQDLEPERAVLIRYDETELTGDDTVTDALNDAVIKGAQYYMLCYSGNAQSDIATQLEIATWVQAATTDIQAMLLTSDATAWSGAGDLTSIRYKLRSASMRRCTVICQPTGTVNGNDLTNVRPDAAIIGRMMPTFPETQGIFEQWNYKQLSLVYDCGFTASQRLFLRENGGNYIESINGISYNQLFPGRTCNGTEIRMQWGADWYDANVEASYFNYGSKAGLMAFDDETFGEIESILRDWLGRSTSRRLLTEYSVTLPDPLTIPASVRATGVLSVVNAYSGTMNSAIDQISTTGTWSIGGV